MLCTIILLKNKVIFRNSSINKLTYLLTYLLAMTVKKTHMIIVLVGISVTLVPKIVAR